MWGEGASDLWGRLKAGEDDRGEAELEAVRARLRLAVQEREGGSWRNRRVRPEPPDVVDPIDYQLVLAYPVPA